MDAFLYFSLYVKNGKQRKNGNDETFHLAGTEASVNCKYSTVTVNTTAFSKIERTTNKHARKAEYKYERYTVA